jgi:hypothetical protein
MDGDYHLHIPILFHIIHNLGLLRRNYLATPSIVMMHLARRWVLLQLHQSRIMKPPLLDSYIDTIIYMCYAGDIGTTASFALVTEALSYISKSSRMDWTADKILAALYWLFSSCPTIRIIFLLPSAIPLLLLQLSGLQRPLRLSPVHSFRAPSSNRPACPPPLQHGFRNPVMRNCCFPQDIVT